MTQQQRHRGMATRGHRWSVGCLALAMVWACAVAVWGPGGALGNEADPARNACGLLTSAQEHQLRVNDGVAQADGVTCVWRTITVSRGGEYLGRLVRAPFPGGGAAPEINNLPTTKHTPEGTDPNAYCAYLVAVSPDEAVWAQYGGPRQPGITNRIACRNAQAAAAAMASSYYTLRNTG